MGRVYLCLGKNAEVPFYFERARVHVWNVEELCFFLKENIWVLEPALLSSELTGWVGEQCGLSQLASKLELSLQKEKPMEAFVQELFGYTCYYDKEELRKMEKVLSANADADELKRQKARGDYFLENGRLLLALSEYEELLSKPVGAKTEVLAAVWHNRGVAQAGLFWFDRAADSFEQAYRICQTAETARQYLAAKRMLLTPQEYVDFLAQRPDLYQASLELERQLEQYETAWMASEAQADISQALEARKEGSAHLCEEMVTEKIGPLQDKYRQAVAK